MKLKHKLQALMTGIVLVPLVKIETLGVGWKVVVEWGGELLIQLLKF